MKKIVGGVWLGVLAGILLAGLGYGVQWAYAAIQNQVGVNSYGPNPTTGTLTWYPFADGSVHTRLGTPKTNLQTGVPLFNPSLYTGSNSFLPTYGWSVADGQSWVTSNNVYGPATPSVLYTSTVSGVSHSANPVANGSLAADNVNCTSPSTCAIFVKAALAFVGTDGGGYDRATGSVASGLDVNLKGQTGITSGAGFYSIKSANLTTASQNFPFALTSKKVSIQTPITNTDEVCISWTGGTAVCPAANTSGNQRVAAGVTLLLDEFAQTSLSAIAASGTQVLYITAWN